MEDCIKGLESYKWDKEWEIKRAYEYQIEYEGFDVILNSGKQVPVAGSRSLSDYKLILDTYQTGDYILDKYKVPQYLSIEELSELVTSMALEGKRCWKYRNDLLLENENASTIEEVEAISWSF